LRALRPHVVQVHESDAGLAALLTWLMAPWLEPRPLLVALLQVSYWREIRAVRALRHAGRVLGRPGFVEWRFVVGKGPLQVLFGWLTARLSRLIFAPSARTAAEIETDYGVRGVRVLPNVTGGLETVAEPVSAAAAEPGYLLYVGRLRIRKGVEVLLEAVAELRRRHPEVRLLIAGTGEHLAALRRTTCALGLDDRVFFLGRSSAGQVRTLLGAARCLVVPSTYEGMPLVILEAMAAGRAVVASAVSGIPEVVVDGETGWLVPPEDPPRLAAALAAALSDDAEVARRGAAGRARALERYTPPAAAALWEQTLAEIAQEL
jgi:glycosyltransferase involved in cell wall biosynthesis